MISGRVARVRVKSLFRAALPGDRGVNDASSRQASCPRIRHTGQLPPLAAHIVTPRRGYLHHGIYVGDGKVVHYAGLKRAIHREPVEEVSLSDFAGGRSFWVKSDTAPRFEHREVIRRARSRIGEDCYRLLTNNCEHFCEWCLRSNHRSYQVEAWAARAKRVMRAAMRWRDEEFAQVTRALPGNTLSGRPA